MSSPVVVSGASSLGARATGDVRCIGRSDRRGTGGSFNSLYKWRYRSESLHAIRGELGASDHSFEVVPPVCKKDPGMFQSITLRQGCSTL